MAIASGVIFGWPSTAASIPAGWNRETGLDSKYVRGAGGGADADLASAFGSATHTHTENTGGGTTHTPIEDAHFHNTSAGSATGTIRRPNTVGDGGASSGTHTHVSKASTSVTGTSNAGTSTLTAYTNDLQRTVVIWIKSDGTPTGIPNGAYGFFQSDTLPGSWNRINGDGYLKGAAAGGDGGATAGANTHQHVESGSHTHTDNAHGSGHNANSSAPSASTNPNDGDQLGLDSSPTHLHAITFNSATPTQNSISLTTDSVNIEPPFLKINTIVNATGGESFPDQIIGLWGGTHAAIPTASGWARYTALDTLFQKGANADGESEITTGGTASGHSHTASCQPTGIPHTHTSSAGLSGNGSCTSIINRSGGVLDAINTHTHVWTIANATITYQATAVAYSASASDAHIPAYAKVIFIRWTQPAQIAKIRRQHEMTRKLFSDVRRRQYARRN